jgi:hypothetical protein
MKQHEREYFISRIRSGLYTVKYNESRLKILTPTIEDELEINEAFMESYESSLERGLKTEDEMIEWMIERGLWENKDEERIKGLEKDIERLKLEIYQAANDDKLKSRIRLYLRAGEKQLSQMHSKKSKYFLNTCEGVANICKIHKMLKLCTYNGSDLCDFDLFPIDLVSNYYFSKVLGERKIRELARTDPWRGIWSMNDSGAYKLFSNSDRQLSIDQRNILIWSRMYDNVQESLECPSDDIIEDDDMLDGWFISQRKKREQEKAEAEVEGTMNEKVANSSEVYVVAKSEKDHQRIESLNNPHAKMVKKQRMAVIKEKGEASQLDFHDEKLKMRAKQTQQYKEKFRR